jgi:hypothetical protein
MQYDIDRDKAKEPSIAEMTTKAIKMLQKNDKGFFLLVEGKCCADTHSPTKRDISGSVPRATALDLNGETAL